ncbi:MAG: signal peptidase I [Hymenobacteraceae bacterium]|nr:signal peptidase I [Hymenobacteraceae bacterium]
MKMKYWKRKQPSKGPKKKKSFIREWADALVFAVVVASFIRWATFEAYAIPTPSMEGSLLVGDYLFVSKLHYGSRTPMTPLQVPLTHQKIWGTDLASYSDAIRLEPFRLPGFSEIKHNDPVVFNFPAEDEHPVDLKTNYIKRAVGMAGDTLAIRNARVYINGNMVENPQEEQHQYGFVTDRVLSESFFMDRGIKDVYHVEDGYVACVSPEKAEELASLDFIYHVKPLLEQPGEAGAGIFPQRPETYKWNKDNFGPLYIPEAGATVSITPETLPLYERVILQYEQNENAVVQEGKLFIDGQEVTQYTFKQNYYFMMGDNRDNSLDSRYWGFVPEDHIVGKAVFVWMSRDPSGGFLDGIRWGRLFSVID